MYVFDCGLAHFVPHSKQHEVGTKHGNVIQSTNADIAFSSLIWSICDSVNGGDGNCQYSRLGSIYGKYFLEPSIFAHNTFLIVQEQVLILNNNNKSASLHHPASFYSISVRGLRSVFGRSPRRIR
jgi:hypothetical protein